MKKNLTFILTAILAMAGVARGDLITVTSTNAPETIADNNSLGLQQTLNLTGYSGWIESLTVDVTISGINGGAFNGDFYLTLQHESGYAVLLNRVGVTGLNPFGYADNGFDVTFAEGGSDIHTYQSGSYSLGPSGELTGTWGVDGRAVDPALVTASSPQTTSLGSFTNASPNGTWTLFVADMNQGGQGRLDSWSINVNVVPEPASVSLVLLGLLGARGMMHRRRKN